jgi:hypothetical protein
MLTVLRSLASDTRAAGALADAAAGVLAPGATAGGAALAWGANGPENAPASALRPAAQHPLTHRRLFLTFICTPRSVGSDARTAFNTSAPSPDT